MFGENDMNDEEFMIELNKEFEDKKRESSIRIIAEEVYEFLDKYYIELTTIERERLCLYLVHYRDSIKAAAHIYPINPSLKKIPHCIDKISRIIDDTSQKLLEGELMEQCNRMDQLFNASLQKKSLAMNNDIKKVQ